jgi:hypothetical protein
MPRQTSPFACAVALLGLLVSGCSERPADAETLAADPAPAPKALENAAPASSAPIVASASAAAPPSAPPSPPPATEPPHPSVFSKARFAWVHTAPSHASGWVGYLGLGGAVPLAAPTPEEAKIPGGLGCTWYRVAPSGFMCAGGAAATLDPEDPVYAYLRRYAPDVRSPWPYRYGESIGLRRYAALPTPAQQRRDEWDLDEHMAKVAAARELTEGATVDADLAGVDLTPARKGPPELLPVGPLVREARNRVVEGSTVAYVDELDEGGRTFLLTSDHALVPKDRVRPYPKSEFAGVRLGESVSLPIAFFRKRARPKFVRDGSGAMVEKGEDFARLAWTKLDGQRVEVGGEVYLGTGEPAVFVRESDATVVANDTPTPKLALRSSGRKTWMEISVLGGWLIAYEGEQPVFATLISPGRGGLPVPGRDPLETASTPIGTFRVDGKFLTATMVSSSNDLIVHTEVQYVQNFHGPHALHGAYWHDVWGEPKSGGCVNLSPRDSQWLFGWTEPTLPPGWHGMRSVKERGPATLVVVHR